MTSPPRPLLAALLCLAASGPAAAQEKAAPGGGAAPASQPADAAFEAARAAFEPLPEPDRKAIQDALAWVAGYNSVVSGAFGRRTYDAILAFQRRANLRPDGVLDAPGRAALAAAAKKARDAVRFAVVTDERSGAQIGIPAATLPRREPNTGGGTRWQSADGRITLDTRVAPEGEDLAAIYERLTAAEAGGREANGRKVTYKLLRPDFLVVAGETASGRFYIRYASAGAALRGFSLGYDKAVAAGFDPLVIAIANSFQPVPGPAPAALAAPNPPARPSPGPAAAFAPPPGPVPPAGPSGSGLVVAPRRVLAALPTPCPAPVIGRARARLLTSDPASGLALLEAEGAPSPAPIRARRGAPPADEGVIVLGHAGGPSAGGPSAGGPSAGLVAVPGHLDAGGRLLAPLQPGAGGGVVLDRGGALVGIVGALIAAPRQVAGIVPPLSHPVVPADAAAAFLEAQGIRLGAAEAGPTRSAGEIAAPLAGIVVAVACGR